MKNTQINNLECYIKSNGYHITKMEAAMINIYNLPTRLSELCDRRGYERLENHWVHRKGKPDYAIYRVRKL